MSASAELFGALDDEIIAAMTERRSCSFRAGTPAMRALVDAHAFANVHRRAAHSDRTSLALAPASGGYGRTPLPAASAVDLFDSFPDGGALLMLPPSDPLVLSAARELCAEHSLGEPAALTAELILTRAGHLTRVHVDDCAGVNIQLCGRKRWRVAAAAVDPTPRGREMPYVAHPEDGERDPESRLTRELVMEPGDCLFVPSGCHHAVEGLDDSVSLLVTFWDGGARWVDALEAVLTRVLLADASSRRPWTHAPAAEARATGRALLGTLAREIAALSPESLLASLGRQ